MLDLTAAFAAFPVLETERFLLRAVTLDDVADIFRDHERSAGEALLWFAADGIAGRGGAARADEFKQHSRNIPAYAGRSPIVRTGS